MMDENVTRGCLENLTRIQIIGISYALFLVCDNIIFLIVRFLIIFATEKSKDSFNIYKDISLDKILRILFDLLCSLGFIYIAYTLGKRASQQKRRIKQKKSLLE